MTDTVTTAPQIDTTRLRELAEAAVPGPWTVAPWHTQSVVAARDDQFMNTVTTDDATATFIAAANPETVIALCDAVDTWKKHFAAATTYINALEKRNTEASK